MKRYIRSSRPVSTDLEELLPKELKLKQWYGGTITGVDIDKAIDILLKDGWRANKWTHTGDELLYKEGNTLNIWMGESPKYAYVEII